MDGRAMESIQTERTVQDYQYGLLGKARASRHHLRRDHRLWTSMSSLLLISDEVCTKERVFHLGSNVADSSDPRLYPQWSNCPRCGRAEYSLSYRSHSRCVQWRTKDITPIQRCRIIWIVQRRIGLYTYRSQPEPSALVQIYDRGDQVSRGS